MDDKNFWGGIGGVILIIIIFSSLLNKGTGTITAYGALCRHPIVNGICDNPIGAGAKEKFTVYMDTQQVVSSFNESGDVPQRYTNCAIQDVKNWSCKSDNGVLISTIGFSQGNFFQDASTEAMNNQLGIYYVPWWRWWLMDFGITGSSTAQ